MNSTALPLTCGTQGSRRAALLNYFSLFSSFSTLICCALPSVLVLLGMGTAVASLLSAAPWLVSLSRHKIWTFSIAGTLIAASFVMTYAHRAKAAKPAKHGAADDPATTCGEVSKVSRFVPLGLRAHLEWRLLCRLSSRANTGAYGPLGLSVIRCRSGR